jgi:putative transposase
VGLQVHVVFVPKRRRKAVFGNIRRQPGPIFHALAKQTECQILEGHLMAATYTLSGKEWNFSSEHFWARGYAASTVGLELEQVRQYIRERDAADGREQF